MSFQIILILVCFQSIQDAQIAEWATRAFLLYGGSPTATVLPAAAAAGAPPGYHPSQLTSFHEQASFHPGIASTPGIRKVEIKGSLCKTVKFVGDCEFFFVNQLLHPMKYYRVTRTVVLGRNKYSLLRPETTLLVTLYVCIDMLGRQYICSFRVVFEPYPTLPYVLLP